MSSQPGKCYTDVGDTRIAYIEQGIGSPLVFLHGNPTSSYLWRNVMPMLAPYARCIAIDLPGMGDSGKLATGPDSYRFKDHAKVLDAFLLKIGATHDVSFVLHDWGSALGFDWARRHPEAVKGLAYMEGFVTPLQWTDWPESIRGLFGQLRSKQGEELILEKNFFIEKILPGSIIRRLSEEEMEEYRRPFLQAGEDRRPMLSWPRELPLDGEPADVVGIVNAYASWLATTDIPKLFVNADPGAILIGRQRDFCRRFKNQTEVTVPGIHFIQEDSAVEIATALRSWYVNKVKQ